MTKDDLSFGRHRRPKRILFVCTGNTCRSPMAEALLRDMITRGEAPDLKVKSAGTAAAAGSSVAADAQKVLAERGVEVEGFRSQPLTTKLVDWADLILTMTRQHKMEVLMRFPQAWKRVAVLSEWAEGEAWRPIIKAAEELYEAIGQQQEEQRQAQAEEHAELERQRLDLRRQPGVDEDKLAQIEADLSGLAQKVAAVGQDERRELAALEQELSDLEVADPIGQGLAAYRATADRLVDLFKKLADRLAMPAGSGPERRTNR